MEASQNNVQNEDYIDFIKPLSKIWNKKILVFKSLIIFGIIGVLVALSTPNQYTASSMFTPNYGGESNGSSGLKGLASLAGINLTAMGESSKEISPMLYGKILESATFKKQLLESPLKNLGEVKTLHEYFNSSKSSFSILGTIKEYTIGLPSKIFIALKSNSNEISYEEPIIGIESISKEDMICYNLIDGMLSMDINDRGGFIEMIAVSDNPHVAAQIAKNGELILQNQIIQIQTKSSMELLSYLEGQYAEKRDLLNNAQDLFSEFKDRNLNISSNKFLNNQLRLETELQTVTAVFQNIVTQLEQVKLQVTKDTPVFSILKPVVFPNKRSAPNRILIMIGWMFTGIILSVSFIFMQEPFQKILKEIYKYSKV